VETLFEIGFDGIVILFYFIFLFILSEQPRVHR